MKEDKRVLGLTSKVLWITNRVMEVNDAIKRYEAAGINVPIDWYIEYHELMAMLLKLEKKGEKAWKRFLII